MTTQPKELDWNQMFAYDLAAVRPAKVHHECCAACREAREVKCVCMCGGKNHGAANRIGMEALDKTLGLGTPLTGEILVRGLHLRIGCEGNILV